jgi:hypothetical protein
MTGAQLLEERDHRVIPLVDDPFAVTNGLEVAVEHRVDSVHGTRRTGGLDEVLCVRQRSEHHLTRSYLSGHDVPLGALAYPPHDDDEATADLDGPWSTRAGQHVRFVRLPVSTGEATRDLRALLEERPDLNPGSALLMSAGQL